MIQIIIPAAGNGQRFIDAGYDGPKHLIDVLGKPMIDRVLDNLRPSQPHSIQVITKDQLKKPSGGAVETILSTDISDEPLLIANCDQIADMNPDEFIDTVLDGRLVVFNSNKPHHSYVKVEDGIITAIKEKEVISNNAVTGIYYFRSGAIFQEAAEKVIKEDKRVKGEFYVSTVIDQLIRDGYKLGVYEADTAILGTPEELQLFLMAARVAAWV